MKFLSDLAFISKAHKKTRDWTLPPRYFIIPSIIIVLVPHSQVVFIEITIGITKQQIIKFLYCQISLQI